MWKFLIISNMLIILGITFVLGIINIVIYNKKKQVKLKELSIKDYVDILWKSMLPAYLFAVVNITFIDKIQGFSFGSSVNLQPFRSIETLIENMIYSSEYLNWYQNLGIEIDFIIGNTLLFLPFGFLIPAVFKKIDKYYKIFGVSLATVLLVEIMQVVLNVGSFDMDDVIYNVLGSILGYGIYLIYLSIFIKREKRLKTAVFGFMPCIIIMVLSIGVVIGYSLLPYGFLPGFKIYDAKEQKEDVKVSDDLDEEEFEEYVYKRGKIKKFFKEKDKIATDIFGNLNLEFEKGNKKSSYFSKDGKYSLEIEDDRLVLTNKVNNEIYEKEFQGDDEEYEYEYEERKNVNIDRNQINSTIKEALRILGSTEINMTDKWYVFLNECYPYDISVDFRGYEEGNQKIVKGLGINLTESGEIATISLRCDSYTKTKDRIKQISTKEAFELLKKGKTGYHLEKDEKIVSVDLSWMHNSTKGYNLPIYIFSILPEDKDIDYIYFAYVRGWKFE